MNQLQITSYPAPVTPGCPPFVAVQLGLDGETHCTWHARTVEDLEGLLGVLLQSAGKVEELLKIIAPGEAKPEVEDEGEQEGDLAASFRPDTFDEAEGLR